MDKRPWNTQLSIGGFAVGTLIGFIGLMFSGLAIHGLYTGSYSAGAGILAIALSGALGIGILMAIKAPTWPFMKALSRYSVNNAELDAPPVTASIDRGPHGTTYRVVGACIQATAKNRGLRGYFVLTIFAVVAGGLLITCKSGPEHHGVAPNAIWSPFVAACGLIAAYYVFFGSTSIQIDCDRIDIIEGVPGFRKRQSIAKDLIARISVRRFRQGKGTKIVVVIDDSMGHALAKFGAELPWQRLCYMKQVLQELIIDSQLGDSRS